jgi:hypothetical protein
MIKRFFFSSFSSTATPIFSIVAFHIAQVSEREREREREREKNAKFIDDSRAKETPRFDLPFFSSSRSFCVCRQLKSA